MCKCNWVLCGLIQILPTKRHSSCIAWKGHALLRWVRDGLELARIMPSRSPIHRCCLLLGTGAVPIAISLCHFSGWSGQGSYRAIILTVTRKLIFCVHYVGWTCLVHNASSWIHRCHPSLYYKLQLNLTKHSSDTTLASNQIPFVLDSSSWLQGQ